MKHLCWRQFLLVLLLGSAPLLVAHAQTSSFPPQTNCVYDLSAVTQAFTNTLANAGIANGSLLILKDGQKLHELYAGNYNPNTLRLIASSSKWLSAIVIMSLVDEGLMSLDDPVSHYFPQYYTGLKGTITIRQMFSHTSGLPGEENSDVLSANNITSPCSKPHSSSPPTTLSPHPALRFVTADSPCNWLEPALRLLPVSLGQTSFNSDSNAHSALPPRPMAVQPIPASPAAFPARFTNTPLCCRCY